uniref:NIMA related kinase 10 n=1 Tax=Amphiprion percula TaxID=161767 RepID=A0A3P8U530_AMPPE
RASHDLRRLQSLLAKSRPRQEVSNKQRCFSSHPLCKLFSDILTSLVNNRLCSDWIDHAPPESVLRVLICLRLLIRDPHHQVQLEKKYILRFRFRTSQAVAVLISGGFTDCLTDIFQKLSAAENQRVWVIKSGAHRVNFVFFSCSPECKKEIGELPIVESLLVILQEYDLLSKRMSAELLRLLSPVQHVRDQVRELEGVPVLLSLLHGQHLKLLWSVAWVLVQLCEDPDTRAEIRSWGGVQQLLRLLNSDRRFVSDHSSIETLSSANAAGRIQREHMTEQLSPQEEADNTAALQKLLTEFILGSLNHLIKFHQRYQKLSENNTLLNLFAYWQCYAFRTLRFLFSVERNRHLFKRLFPTDLFELFIDVGHYVRDLTAYEGLQTKVSLYTEVELDSLNESIEVVDQNRPPLRVINGYSILDHLGTGAFGSVFKVLKQSGQNLLALKEVNLHNPAFGKDKKSRDSNVEKIISELTIIKEQMTHPNIVKYYKTFLEGDKLYIVMELIEGVPLAEHFNSLKEKQQQLTEDRIWNIFIQVTTDDLSPHWEISPFLAMTDFGLAKQKQENSKLTSVVGTILYSCPEVVKNEPYGEKADIWALGCILYQMATLQPPFYSSNMLSLASKIVEAVYEPVEEGAFSERVTEMIRWCLSPDAEQRPDIVAVSSRISDLMMRLMDGLYTSHNALERRAERDRKRAQKYFHEKHKSWTDYSHSNPSRSLIKCVCPVYLVLSISVCVFALASVSGGICVSQKKLRQIDDPIQRLLVQLHKIVYITQLPPAPHHNIKRRLIERFKKSLFHFGSDPCNLKVELTISCSNVLFQGIIEELLEENGYYETTDSR